MGGITSTPSIVVGTGLSGAGTIASPLINAGVTSFNGGAGAVTGVSSFNGGTGAITGVSSFNGGTGAVSFTSGVTVDAMPAYFCRAWVNFNGSVPSIRAGGNVSSVARASATNYSINFNTAMPDANYCAVGTTNLNVSPITFAAGGTSTTSTLYLSMGGSTDATTFSVAVFR